MVSSAVARNSDYVIELKKINESNIWNVNTARVERSTDSMAS